MTRNEAIKKAKLLKEQGGVGSKKVDMSNNDNKELLAPMKRIKRLLGM